MLQEAFGNNAVSQSKTFLWYKRFKDGRTSVDDDTSIIVTNDNKIDFRHTLHLAMIEISNWFQCNRLTINYDKTHFLQFLTKNKIKCNNK